MEKRHRNENEKEMGHEIRGVGGRMANQIGQISTETSLCKEEKGRSGGRSSVLLAVAV